MCYIAEHRLFMWQRFLQSRSASLFYLGALPIYATTLIILIHVVLLIVTRIFGLGTSTYAPFSFTAPEVVDKVSCGSSSHMPSTTPANSLSSSPSAWSSLPLRDQVEQYLGDKRLSKALWDTRSLPPVLFCLLYLVLGRQNIFYLATSSTIDTASS